MAGKPGGKGGIPTKYTGAQIGLSLFDLGNDIGETTDVKDKYPEILTKMKALGEAMRKDLGDNRNPGTGRRPAGRL